MNTERAELIIAASRMSAWAKHPPRSRRERKEFAADAENAAELLFNTGTHLPIDDTPDEPQEAEQ